MSWANLGRGSLHETVAKDLKKVGSGRTRLYSNRYLRKKNTINASEKRTLKRKLKALKNKNNALNIPIIPTFSSLIMNYVGKCWDNYSKCMKAKKIGGFAIQVVIYKFLRK